MSFFYNFFIRFFSLQKEEIIPLIEEDDEITFIQHSFTPKDLGKVTLKAPKIRQIQNEIKVDMKNLNNSQLKQILGVKLKPVIKMEVKKEYKIRHPVLEELLEKSKKK